MDFVHHARRLAATSHNASAREPARRPRWLLELALPAGLVETAGNAPRKLHGLATPRVVLARDRMAGLPTLS
jgi:hypothetical protein